MRFMKAIVLLICTIAMCNGFTADQPTKFSAFYTAVSQGNIPEAKALLAENPKLINATDGESKQTVLHGIKDIKMAEFLLSKGANLKARDQYGSEPLVFAIRGRRKDMVEFLVSKGADVKAVDDQGLTPIYWARTTEIMEFIISKGGDPKTRTKNGVTPFHFMVESAPLNVLELLLKKGADINAKDNEGRTPLDYTNLLNSKSVIDFLEKNGGVRGK